MGTIPKEAPNDVLQKPRGLLLNQLVDHVAQKRPDGVEPLVGRAYVVEAVVVHRALPCPLGSAESCPFCDSTSFSKDNVGKHIDMQHMDEMEVASS